MEEKILQGKKNGMLVLVITTLLYIAAGVGLVFGILEDSMVLLVVTIVWLAIGWIPWLGLKVLKPQEALVLTLFGKYYGTLMDDGFYFVNPFCVGVNPAAQTKLNQSGDVNSHKKSAFNLTLGSGADAGAQSSEMTSKKISMKIMTLNNNKQKINDCLGNPVEIAAVMLQRQQASAVVDARAMIVDGAVGMVKMALEKLDEDGIVDLDEERKAAMVSNLLVVLCGNHDAQPIVNSGSLY